MKKAFLSISFLIISLVIVCPPSATAQEPQNYIILKAGVFIPAYDLEEHEFDTGFNGEIVLGRHNNRNFAIEGGVGYYETESSYSEYGFLYHDKIKVIPVTLTAKGIIFSETAELYGGGGIGFYAASLRRESYESGIRRTASDTDTVPGFHVVVGINFNTSENVFIGVEGKYVLTDRANFKGTSVFPVSRNLNGYFLTGNIGFRF